MKLLLKQTIILALIAGLVSCSKDKESIEPVEVIEYFTEYDSTGSFYHNGWRVQINLEDSFVYTTENIEALKLAIESAESYLPTTFLDVAKSINHIKLANNHLQGEYEYSLQDGIFKGELILKPPYQDYVLVHELGHARYIQTGSYNPNGYLPSNVIDIFDTQQELWNGQYASTNYQEYFAELFRYYYMDPSYLQTKDSVGYEFIKKVVIND